MQGQEGGNKRAGEQIPPHLRLTLFSEAVSGTLRPQAVAQARLLDAILTHSPGSQGACFLWNRPPPVQPHASQFKHTGPFFLRANYHCNF